MAGFEFNFEYTRRGILYCNKKMVIFLSLAKETETCQKMYIITAKEIKVRFIILSLLFKCSSNNHFVKYQYQIL